MGAAGGERQRLAPGSFHCCGCPPAARRLPAWLPCNQGGLPLLTSTRAAAWEAHRQAGREVQCWAAAAASWLGWWAARSSRRPAGSTPPGTPRRTMARWSRSSHCERGRAAAQHHFNAGQERRSKGRRAPRAPRQQLRTQPCPAFLAHSECGAAPPEGRVSPGGAAGRPGLGARVAGPAGPLGIRGGGGGGRRRHGRGGGAGAGAEGAVGGGRRRRRRAAVDHWGGRVDWGTGGAARGAVGIGWLAA